MKRGSIYGRVFVRRKRVFKKSVCGHPFRYTFCKTCNKKVCPACAVMTDDRCQKCTVRLEKKNGPR